MFLKCHSPFLPNIGSLPTRQMSNSGLRGFTSKINKTHIAKLKSFINKIVTAVNKHFIRLQWDCPRIVKTFFLVQIKLKNTFHF